MSLTTFVELPEVKQFLRETVTKPWFQVRAEIKAPPLSESYGWTGTAFDYLLHFYIKNYLWSSADSGKSWRQWSTGWTYVEMWASAIGCAISGNTVYEISSSNPAVSLGSPSSTQTVGCLTLPLDNDAVMTWMRPVMFTTTMTAAGIKSPG
jgi:hypothetical protein